MLAFSSRVVFLLLFLPLTTFAIKCVKFNRKYPNTTFIEYTDKEVVECPTTCITYIFNLDTDKTSHDKDYCKGTNSFEYGGGCFEEITKPWCEKSKDPNLEHCQKNFRLTAKKLYSWFNGPIMKTCDNAPKCNHGLIFDELKDYIQNSKLIPGLTSKTSTFGPDECKVPLSSIKYIPAPLPADSPSDDNSGSSSDANDVAVSSAIFLSLLVSFIGGLF